MKSIHVYISHISLLRHSKIKTQLRRNDKINEAVVHISGQIMDITVVAQQMSASATHIVDAMQQIATLSQDASGNSESVAAASEEQIASMQEVTAAAESLSQRAESLLREMHFFKIQ